MAVMATIALFITSKMVEGPAVDFSREGQVCRSDVDCLPTPDFEGISAICFENKCVWNKYITNEEVFTGLAFMAFAFAVLPLIFLLVVTNLVRRYLRNKEPDDL